MRVIARGRQAGKTYDLIQWVKEGRETNQYPGWSRVLLCHTLAEAQRIRTSYDVDYRQVFAVSEWTTEYIPLRHEVQIAVDNADLVLASLLGQMPTQIAVTGSTE